MLRNKPLEVNLPGSFLLVFIGLYCLAILPLKGRLGQRLRADGRQRSGGEEYRTRNGEVDKVLCFYWSKCGFVNLV